MGAVSQGFEGVAREAAADWPQGSAGSASEAGAPVPAEGEGGRAESGAPGEGGERRQIPGETAPEVGLQRALERLLEEKERLSHQLLRLQADFDNYRRRARSELERAVEEALGKLAGRLLSVVDNLERALASLPASGGGNGEPWSSLATGLRMVHQELLRVLADEGIQRIAAAGEVFDPTVHQAVERVSVTKPGQDMRVLEELQPGYLFRGRVLRPSLVRVAVFVPSGSGDPKSEAEAVSEAFPAEGERASPGDQATRSAPDEGTAP